MTPPATTTTSCSELVAAFCARWACAAFAVSGGASGTMYSALAGCMPLFVHARNEADAVSEGIEASLRTGRLAAVSVTAGEAVFKAMGTLPTARSEGAKVLLLYATSDPKTFGRSGIQPTEPDTLPAAFFQAGPLLDFGALVSHPEQLPRVLSRIAVGAQRVSGFVAGVGLSQAVQGAPAPSLGPIDVRVTPPGPAPEAVSYCARMLEQSFALVAGFGSRHAVAQVRELARRSGARAFTTPRAKGVIAGPCIGLAGVEHYYDVDARPARLLVLGSRLSEASCLWDPRLLPREEIIHVDTDASCFGAAFPDFPTYGVVSEVGLFLNALLQHMK